MYRQGDVLIIARAIPADAEVEKLKKNEDLVLALGEVTGHRHRFARGKNVRAYRKGPDRFLEVVGRGSRLVHEEHSEIDVPPGTYEVIIQSQYNEGEARRVED